MNFKKTTSLIKNAKKLTKCHTTMIASQIKKLVFSAGNHANQKYHSTKNYLILTMKYLYNLIRNFACPKEIHFIIVLNETPKNALLKHQTVITSCDYLCINPSQTETLNPEFNSTHHGNRNTCVILSSDSQISSKQITQLTKWTQKHLSWHFIKPIATMHFLLNSYHAPHANTQSNSTLPPAWISVAKAIYKKVHRLQFHLCVLETTHTVSLSKANTNPPSDWVTGAIHTANHQNRPTHSTDNHDHLKQQIKKLLIQKQFNQLLLTTCPNKAIAYSKSIFLLTQYMHQSIDLLYRLTQLLNPNSTHYITSSINYSHEHDTGNCSGNTCTTNLLTKAQHKLSRYKKRHGKHKMRTLCQWLISIGLAFICLHQHHQSHHAHILRQQLNKNWHILHKKHNLTKGTLSFNQLYKLHMLQVPASFLHLWWNNYDIKSIELYNNALKKAAKRSLILPALNMYHDKIAQLEIQMTSNGRYLSRLAQLYEALSFSYQLTHPDYIHHPYFINKISHLTWNIQHWHQTTDNTEASALNLQQITLLCHWVWDTKQNTPAAFSRTPTKTITTQLKTIKHDLLGPAWRASPILKRPNMQRNALKLISIINQPTSFLRHLPLSYFIHSTILTSKIKIAPLNDPTFYTEKLLPSIRRSYSNPSPFLQAILYPAHNSKNAPKPLLKGAHDFYANQYHRQWAHFINNWRLHINSTSTNDIHWLINLSNPNSDFSHAVLYAKKQLTRSFAPQKHHINILANALAKKISMKTGLPIKTPHTKPPSKINFEKLLSIYQKHLVQLFAQTQPIFTSDNSGEKALDYARGIARPGKNPPAFLLTLNTINQIKHLIPNPQAKSALSHLLSLPLHLIWNKINSIACHHLNHLWSINVYQPYINNIAHTYPSNPNAATDGDPDFFQNFMLTPNHGLARFLKQNIYPFLSMGGQGKWTVLSQNGFFIHINPQHLSQLQFITNQIKVLTACSNKHALCLAFATHPIPNPKLDSIKLNLGKWHFAYHNGPEVWNKARLIFPQPIEYASLHLKTIYRQNIITRHSSGQYASLHLLSLAHWKCYPQTLSCNLTWTSRSHQLKPSIKLRGILLPDYYSFIKNGIILPKTIS